MTLLTSCYRTKYVTRYVTEYNCVDQDLPESPGPVFEVCGEKVCISGENFKKFYVYFSDLVVFAREAKAKCGKEKDNE